MKTFDEIYAELQGTEQTELKEVLEEAKKESTKKNKIALFVCLIVDAVILSFAFSGISAIVQLKTIMFLQTLMTMLIIDLFVYIILSIIFNKNQRKYAKMYKEKIIKKIMNNFYSGLEYFPEKGMPQYIYEELKYNEHYNRYNSEDYLEAVIDEKYSIQMAEVTTVYESRDSDGDTDRITCFHGLFAKVAMNKSINGELKILENGATYSDKQQLRLDSGEFEKYFDVAASDKIEGMQFLTADVMEELMTFVKKTNMQYDVIIKNDILYLRFHSGPMFEPANIKKGYLDKESLREYFYMLNFTYNLSNKLINLIEETEIFNEET